MNGIQRVRNAIAHVNGAPMARGELVLDHPFAQKFARWRAGGAPSVSSAPVDLQLDCCRALGLDLVCLPSVQFEGEDTNLARPGEIVKRFADEGLFVFWLVDGVFQRAARYRGMMALLTRIGQSPAAVQDDFELFSGHVTSSIALGASVGVHGIIIGDDIAYNQSTFVSPAFVERKLLPLWRMYVTQAAALDLPVFFHSDGNLNGVLPLVVAAGFVGLQGIESSAGMAIEALTKHYGGDLCLMGGLSPSLLATPEGFGFQEEDNQSLRHEVSTLIASVAGKGGFIFGTSSGLHAGMSPERVLRAYRWSFKQETFFLADGNALRR